MNEAKQSSHQVDIDVLRLMLSQFSDSHDSWLSKQDFEKKIDEVSDWVQKQKKLPDDKSVIEGVENVCKIANAIVSAAKRFQRGNASDVVSGTMEIISSFVTFAGAVVEGPAGVAVGAIFGTICNIIGAILTAENDDSNKPSVVEQLANVVHKEVVAFNSKLQKQKYNGLKDRVLEQKTQLRTMTSGEELVDRNLWNEYVQFMGEVSDRFESWLPFKYEDYLTRDPDVADFVTAVVTYCKAYFCFLALLLSAKGKFADLEASKQHLPGQKDKACEYMKVIDLKISCQIKNAKRKLSFLSEEKYLTFVGSLPSAGGKLTKIVTLSRNLSARSVVEMVTSSVGLPPLPDFTTVESKAEIISRQSVKLKLEGVPEPSLDSMLQLSTVQFINKTKFPIKIIFGTVGDRVNKFKFTEAVKPASYVEKRSTGLLVSLGGYVIIYLDGKVREDDTPHADVTRVIEFALSNNGLNPMRNKQLVPIKVNIQDMTCSESTKGQSTYSKMESGERTTRTYWVTNDVHHMASGDRVIIVPLEPLIITPFLWQFVVQDFDPFLDVVTCEKQAKKEQESTCLIL